MPPEGGGVRGRLAAAALALGILLIAAANGAAAARQGRLSIDQVRLGNVFDPSEPIRMPVSADASHVLWSLTDFDGVEVASGNTELSSGRGTVMIAPPGLGYFELGLQAPMADGTRQEARTSFVVVPNS